jgi:hypothetical protein
VNRCHICLITKYMFIKTKRSFHIYWCQWCILHIGIRENNEVFWKLYFVVFSDIFNPICFNAYAFSSINNKITKPDLEISLKLTYACLSVSYILFIIILTKNRLWAVLVYRGTKTDKDKNQKLKKKITIWTKGLC